MHFRFTPIEEPRCFAVEQVSRRGHVTRIKVFPPEQRKDAIKLTHRLNKEAGQ